MRYMTKHGLGESSSISPAQWERDADDAGWVQGIWTSNQLLGWLNSLNTAGWNSAQIDYRNTLIQQIKDRLTYQNAGLKTHLAPFSAVDQQAYMDASNRLIAADQAPGEDPHSLSWNVADIIQGWKNQFGVITPEWKASIDAQIAAGEAGRQKILADEATAAAAGKPYFVGDTPPAQFIPQSQGGTMPTGAPPSSYQTAIATAQTIPGAKPPAGTTTSNVIEQVPMWAWVLGGIGTVIVVNNAFSGRK